MLLFMRQLLCRDCLAVLSGDGRREKLRRVARMSGMGTSRPSISVVSISTGVQTTACVIVRAACSVCMAGRDRVVDFAVGITKLAMTV